MSQKNDIVYPRAPVMLVDDEPHALDGLEILLRTEGVTNVLKVADAREVLPLLAKQACSAILLDLTMPHVSGEMILPEIALEYPGIPVIIVTGHNNLETAVRCMKKGAFDFVVKPVDGERVVTSLKHAIGLAELRDENRQLRERMLMAANTLERPECFGTMLSVNPVMLAIFQYIEAVAESTHPVLITGETGVGKELAARAIHAASRRSGRFIAVNVAGLDDQVFTDTLFGHMRGAYTGANEHRAGLIAKAEGGTIFLDEIGDLSQASQVKLLRLLQEAEYFPLGADEPRRTTARVIVATNSDLTALQANGRFRKDLYYRLATHEIKIPPLRQRQEDIPLLAQHFLAEYQQQTGKPAPALPEEIMRMLAAYHYPGNIRELRSIIFDLAHQHARAGTFAIGALRAKLQQSARDLPAPEHDFQMQIIGGRPLFHGALPQLKSITEYFIQEALRRTNGNQTAAARLLGISQQALSKRLRRKRPTRALSAT